MIRWQLGDHPYLAGMLLGWPSGRLLIHVDCKHCQGCVNCQPLECSSGDISRGLVYSVLMFETEVYDAVCMYCIGVSMGMKEVGCTWVS